MRVCPQCGARYETQAVFCPMDGSPLDGSPPADASPPADGSEARIVPVARPTSSSHWEAKPLEVDSSVDTPTASASAPASDEKEEALIGVVLGDRYRIDAHIGSGGMGLVYKATHLLIGRTLAIKVLRRRHAQEEEVAKRFAQEAQVASSVKHVNIVDVLDYGTTPGGSPFCVMEFLAGHSLARELARHGPMDPARVIRLALGMTRGLAAAHRAGIIHRDLKPDNVFLVSSDVGGEEQIKILDFGIARVLGSKSRLTAAGSVVGTPEYMSPEQAQGQELDPRSDLYALGIVLFEAMTGRVPISAASSVGTLTKQVFELAPRLRDVAPQLTHCASLETALGRLLSKNRDERPGSALDAGQLLLTAAANDLEQIEEPHVRAAVQGWAPAHGVEEVGEESLRRRSTIMIGSGSVASEWEHDGEGPATGSFSTRVRSGGGVASVATSDPPQASIIIADGIDAEVHVPISRTPTPNSTQSIGRPSRRSFLARHLPLILVCIGAAIFAGLVTIGFMRWLQSQEGGAEGGSGQLDSPALDASAQSPRLSANMGRGGAVEQPAREQGHMKGIVTAGDPVVRRACTSSAEHEKMR